MIHDSTLEFGAHSDRRGELSPASTPKFLRSTMIQVRDRMASNLRPAATALLVMFLAACAPRGADMSPSPAPLPSPTPPSATAAMWTDYVPFARQLHWKPLYKSARTTTNPQLVLQRACGGHSDLADFAEGGLTAAVATAGTGPN